MAGSYEHLDNGIEMIENLGDAYECIEELYYIIHVLGNDADIKKALHRLNCLERKENLNDSPYSKVCIDSFNKTKKMMSTED